MSHNRWLGLVMLPALLALAGAAQAAERVTLEKPLYVSIQKSDKSHLAGDIISYGPADLLVFSKGSGETELVRWEELGAQGRLHDSLLIVWLEGGNRLD